MDKRDFQIAVGAKVDGAIGPLTIKAFYDRITNTNAPSTTPADLTVAAELLRCSVAQIKAVAKVETAGGGFTNEGRPKILFERHVFHRLTDGKHSTSSISNPTFGGYNENSWNKLEAALRVDPWAALMSCSWGKFQIMGYHAAGSKLKGSLNLGYGTVLAMVQRMAETEYAHFDSFIRFIRAVGLADALRKISTDPATNKAFVIGYNGAAGIERNNYHVKLAEAMR